MLEVLPVGIALAPRRVRRPPLRRVRWMWSWLLLAGWIVLPLMPMLALGLSKLLGVGY